jgi:hypothetical protein
MLVSGFIVVRTHWPVALRTPLMPPPPMKIHRSFKLPNQNGNPNRRLYSYLAHTP